jgi:hypothetical protein
MCAIATYKRRCMVTLSPTKARANLTSWLKAASQGEDIGILYGDRIIALRPVSVESVDYAFREYGVSMEDLDKAALAFGKEIDADRETGKLQRFDGKLDKLLGS